MPRRGRADLLAEYTAVLRSPYEPRDAVDAHFRNFRLSGVVLALSAGSVGSRTAARCEPGPVSGSEGAWSDMPLLIIIALVALLILMRRPERGERLPGPIVAALVMTALAWFTASFWLVNLAAFITVIWILRVMSTPQQRGAGGKRRLRRIEHGRQLPRQVRAGWPQLKRERASASRDFEVHVRHFLQEVGRLGAGCADAPGGGPPLRTVSLSKRTQAVEGEHLPKRRGNASAGRAPAHRNQAAQSVADLLRRVQGQLPAEAVTVLRTLERDAGEAGAYLESRGLQDGEFGQLLRQTVQDYAPGAVMAYLRLPPAFASSVRLQGDKTGRDLLMEQLGMLSQALTGLLENAARAESQQLLAHQRFLEQKLDRRERDFEL